MERRKKAPQLVQTAAERQRKKRQSQFLCKHILLSVANNVKNILAQVIVFISEAFIMLDICALIEGNLTAPEFLITEFAAVSLAVLGIVVQKVEVKEC